MFIYNVTTKLHWQIHEAWVQWLTEDHIPAIMDTHCFVDYKVLRLHDVEEEEGPTYAVQYFANNKNDYNRYIEIYAPAMRKDAVDKWGANFIAFRTLMEIVH